VAVAAAAAEIGSVEAWHLELCLCGKEKERKKILLVIFRITMCNKFE
jgi:hypothetical protein